MKKISGRFVLESTRQIIILVSIVALLVTVLVLSFIKRFDRIMYAERQQTLSTITRAAAENLENTIRSEWDIYDLSFSIASECVRQTDDISKGISAINEQHDFGTDYYFLVDEDGGYYCSDGVSGKLSDFSNYTKTSADRLEYLATLPHMNPRKNYMIYRGRFDKVMRMHTEYGDKLMVFFAYAQDLTEIKNSIGGLFEDSSNVFIFDSQGVLLYEDYGLQTLLEGHNVFRKLSQCTMPFGENPEELEQKCRQDEPVVAQCRVKGGDYYFCSAPLAISDWTLALLVAPQTIDIDISSGIAVLVLYGLAILALISGLLVLLTWSFRVKAQEERLDESRKLVAAIEETSRAKSVFLSNMSHDIRTPINGIMGVTTIARSLKDNPEKIEECLDKIEIASSHLLSLINDVLDMSRIESGKTTISSVASDITEICESCASIINGQIVDRDLKFTTDFEVEHPKVFADELHLRRVFINILGNAVKFTRDGGRIFFRCRETGCTDDTVTCRFEVKDTGIGMSKKFLEHVFDAFSQEENRERSKYTGTGLGMSITKQLVELMGGTVEVESEVNKGSSFYVTLSFRRDLEAAVEAEDTAETQAAGSDIAGVKILLVEDNELNMEIAATLLEMNGAIVEKAWDGLEAVDKFTSKDIRAFDVILMDIMMPRMDGFEATRTIRALDREDAADIPIIAMTANAFDDDIRATKEASFNAHLSKPIEIEDVKKTIASFVHKS